MLDSPLIGCYFQRDFQVRCAARNWPLRFSALRWLRQPHPGPPVTPCRAPPASRPSPPPPLLLLLVYLPCCWPRPSPLPFFLVLRACPGQSGLRPSRSRCRPVAARRAGPACGGAYRRGRDQPTRRPALPARPRSQALCVQAS